MEERGTTVTNKEVKDARLQDNGIDERRDY